MRQKGGERGGSRFDSPKNSSATGNGGENVCGIKIYLDRCSQPEWAMAAKRGECFVEQRPVTTCPTHTKWIWGGGRLHHHAERGAPPTQDVSFPLSFPFFFWWSGAGGIRKENGEALTVTSRDGRGAERDDSIKGHRRWRSCCHGSSGHM